MHNTFFKFLIYSSVLCLSFKTHAWTFKKGSQDQFLEQLKPSEKIAEPLGQFFVNSSLLDNFEYATVLFNAHKSQVQKALAQPMLAKGQGCKPKLEVKIAATVTKTASDEHKEFESELIQIESFDCLPAIQIKKAFEVFMSDEFMLSANSNLKSSKTNQSDQTSCQQTQVFPIGKSQYCIKIITWADERTIIATTFNEMNNSAMAAPVFLRLVTTVFKVQDNGTIGFYTLTYGRGPSLPFHSLVKKTVALENTKYLDLFKQALAE